MRRIMFYSMFVLLMLVASISLSTHQVFAATKSVVPRAAKIVPPPGAPTVTCTSDGCDNLDPIVTGCDDSTAKTVKEVKITGAPNTPDAGTLGDLELRFSTTCGTNWTRFTTLVSNVKAVATIERVLEPNVIYLKYCSPVSCYAASNSDFPNGATFWTNMVYAPTTPANACATEVSLTTGRTYKACVQL